MKFFYYLCTNETPESMLMSFCVGFLRGVLLAVGLWQLGLYVSDLFKLFGTGFKKKS